MLVTHRTGGAHPVQTPIARLTRQAGPRLVGVVGSGWPLPCCEEEGVAMQLAQNCLARW